MKTVVSAICLSDIEQPERNFRAVGEGRQRDQLRAGATSIGFRAAGSGRQ